MIKKRSIDHDSLWVRIGKDHVHAPKVEVKLPMREVLEGFASLGDLVIPGDVAVWEDPNLWDGTRDGIRITVEVIPRTKPPPPYEEPTSDPSDLTKRFRED